MHNLLRIANIFSTFANYEHLMRNFKIIHYLLIFRTIPSLLLQFEPCKLLKFAFKGDLKKINCLFLPLCLPFQINQILFPNLSISVYIICVLIIINWYSRSARNSLQQNESRFNQVIYGSWHYKWTNISEN